MTIKSIFAALSTALLCSTVITTVCAADVAEDFKVVDLNTLDIKVSESSDVELIQANIKELEPITPKAFFKSSHYYVSPKDPITQLSHGPFAAVQSGSSDTFDALALGWMVGFDQPDNGAGGWNVGLGVVVKSNYQPVDANDFNRQSQDGVGLVLMSSFSF